MADKTRHAFGNSANLEEALKSGTINNFDILLLDGDTEPKVGWVDANGEIRIAIGSGGSSEESAKEIIRVEELPTIDGDENVIYIYNNEVYIWSTIDSKCIPVSKSVDLSELEGQVNELETQIETKTDVDTVQSMIEEYSESIITDVSNEDIEDLFD